MKSTIKTIYYHLLIIISISGLLTFSGCGEDPVKEDVPELITKVTLVFTPVNGGLGISVSATDPDGEGIQDITADGSIKLSPNVKYSLSISLINELANPASPEYNITEEVEEEGSEHMFFFAWTNNLFSSPSGNGNADNRTDAVNYNDMDDNGYPIGLATNWTTISASGTGTFRIILKHQPELKNATSGSTVGETDLDVTFDLQIQ